DVLQWNEDRIVFDPVLGFRTRPNLDFQFENVEFSTRVQTNSQGYRDDEESLENPEILILGDSFGIGWGVEEEETAASILEDRTGRKVLNMSVSGYGTNQEFLQLQRYCEVEGATDCDVVILFYLNDRLENRSPPGGLFPAMIKQGREIRYTEASEEAVMDCVRSQSQNLTTYLCRHSAVLDLVLSRYANPRKEWANRMYLQFVKHQEEHGPSPGPQLGEFEIFEYTLRYLQVLSEERNLRLHFVFVPFYGYYLGDRVQPPYQEEEAILQRLEIDFLNPFEDFEAEDFYDLDGHFDVSGQRKMGTILAEYFTQKANDEKHALESRSTGE
ncbi:MAG: SGNH/GDSL hydrolase family protein, partial [Candidatus Omnitrophica bacterium]|nr:SGNH/GDSL hydrolase family protein [Candidatus Omnitrophota bacterium]